MKATLGLIAELLKMSLTLAAISYCGLVAVNFVRSGERYQPVVDPESPFRSAGRLLIGAGIFLIAALATLGRPIVDMLAEASAEVGEWALTKRQSQGAVRHQDPVGRAA